MSSILILLLFVPSGASLVIASTSYHTHLYFLLQYGLNANQNTSVSSNSRQWRPQNVSISHFRKRPAECPLHVNTRAFVIHNCFVDFLPFAFLEEFVRVWCIYSFKGVCGNLLLCAWKSLQVLYPLFVKRKRWLFWLMRCFHGLLQVFCHWLQCIHYKPCFIGLLKEERWVNTWQNKERWLLKIQRDLNCLDFLLLPSAVHDSHDIHHVRWFWKHKCWQSRDVLLPVLLI